MSKEPPAIGFVGLGQMGQPMAANVAKLGLPLVCHDKAGCEGRLPDGATEVLHVEDAVAAADTIFLSLPDGKVVNDVVAKIAAVPSPRTTVVIDLSTIGLEAARAAAHMLNQVGIAYIDAPVSGGRAGAIKASITLMWAGSADELKRHRRLAEAFCGNIFHVGNEPGQGQAVKLLNNFLSGTAMAATTEAVLFGLSQGVEMKTILDVVRVSTGQNTAISDKFPNRIVTGRFDAGFFAELLNKDIQLYRQFAAQAGTPNAIGNQIADIWQEVTDDLAPQSDFTLIYEVMRRKTKIGAQRE